jgi:hypothetical protein
VSECGLIREPRRMILRQSGEDEGQEDEDELQEGKEGEGEGEE